MNNGRPPYGQYGQPGNYPQGNVPQGQNPPSYQPQGYQQPNYQVPGYQPQGYQQPSGYPASGYQANTYQQQNQPQQSTPSYQQQTSNPYQTYQPQTYQAQTHQPQTWQQQAWQPYGQEQQPSAYQPYAQQPAQYPQYNQQGQPVYPSQGYSGYVSQPQQAARKKGIPLDVIAKVVLFGVLPVLFVLGLVLGSTALKWVFLAAAVAGIIGMWLTDAVSPNMRLTLSLVYGALAVVALVGALNGDVPDRQNPADGSDTYSQGSYGAQHQGQAGPAGSVSLHWDATDTPSPEPTATPHAAMTDGAAMEQLSSFMYFWSVNNDENMVALTAPSWRASTEDPRKELFKILANRIPDQDYEIDMSGTDNDTQRTAKVKVMIDKNNNRAKERYSFRIIMLKEDGVWYVDPRSLASHDKETPTPATVNTTPTQPPQTTGTPDMKLYYNPDGGSYYHSDPNCSEVGKKFRPLQGVFYYPELVNDPYNKLSPCGPCGVPLYEAQ